MDTMFDPPHPGEIIREDCLVRIPTKAATYSNLIAARLPI
jgi:hypothetical protein